MVVNDLASVAVPVRAVLVKSTGVVDVEIKLYGKIDQVASAVSVGHVSANVKVVCDGFFHVYARTIVSGVQESEVPSVILRVPTNLGDISRLASGAHYIKVSGEIEINGVKYNTPSDDLLLLMTNGDSGIQYN